MTDLPSILGVAALVFASTNIDDVLLLAAFFADPHVKPGAVVTGQFLGIGTLVLISAGAGAAALVIPEGYTSLLGLAPLALGLQRLGRLWARRREAVGSGEMEERAKTLHQAEHRAERQGRSQLFAVAGVTLANGGDNLAVYIPLFASAPHAIPIYAAVFAVMTALWCLIGYGLVNNPVVGRHVRRLGGFALPLVLILLGLWILSGTWVLLR